MNACRIVDRWLEGGEAAGPLPPAAHDHLRDCARCSALVAAERGMVAMLSAPPAAPAGFADEVMRRVAAANAARAAGAHLTAPTGTAWAPGALHREGIGRFAAAPGALHREGIREGGLPLWVRIAADPAVALAAVAAGAFAWKASNLLAIWTAFSQRLAASLPAASLPGEHAFSAFSQPLVQIGLLTGLAVPLVWVSWMLYDSFRRFPGKPGMLGR